jgi:hypothetical protein
VNDEHPLENTLMEPVHLEEVKKETRISGEGHLIQVEALTKSFGNVAAVRGVDLAIGEHEFLSIVGRDRARAHCCTCSQAWNLQTADIFTATGKTAMGEISSDSRKRIWPSGGAVRWAWFSRHFT